MSPPAAPPETPFALVVRAGNALRLSAVGAPAVRAGLGVGMTLADARARCPTLQTLPHDPAADAGLLERLAAHMQRFTPMVATDPPDGLILDITGCAHLFGGEAVLAAQAVADAGLTTRHAFCRACGRRTCVGAARARRRRCPRPAGDGARPVRGCAVGFAPRRAGDAR
jgi:protein ImuB